jgi:hypothetical protein
MLKARIILLVYFFSNILLGQNDSLKSSVLNKLANDFSNSRPQNDSYWTIVKKLDKALFNYLNTVESYATDYKKHKGVLQSTSFNGSNSQKFKLVYFESNLNASNGAIYSHSFIQWKTNDSTCNVFELGKFVDGRELLNTYMVNDSIYLMLFSGYKTMYVTVMKFENNTFVSQNVFPNDYFNNLKNKTESCENIDVKRNYINCQQCEIKYNTKTKILSFEMDYQCNIDDYKDNGVKNIVFKFDGKDFKLLKKLFN